MGPVWRDLRNLPNLLTILRVILVPVLVVVLTDPGPGASLVAGGIFFVACLSDFLDGYLARRWNVTTPLGQILDPLADKLIVAAALVMLAGMDREPSVPAWMVVVILGREMAVTGLRAVALGQGVVLPAEELGKYKMVFQMFALHGLLWHYPFLGIQFHAAGLYFLWISLVISLWSGIDYHVRALRRLLAADPPGASP